MLPPRSPNMLTPGQPILVQARPYNPRRLARLRARSEVSGMTQKEKQDLISMSSAFIADALPLGHVDSWPREKSVTY